jgi:hypothetical protein
VKRRFKARVKPHLVGEEAVISILIVRVHTNVHTTQPWEDFELAGVESVTWKRTVSVQKCIGVKIIFEFLNLPELIRWKSLGDPRQHAKRYYFEHTGGD